MLAVEMPSFDAPHIAAQLNCMSNGELDGLAFGVIEMNHQFKVLRYNTAQSRHSGVPSDRCHWAALLSGTQRHGPITWPSGRAPSPRLSRG